MSDSEVSAAPAAPGVDMPDFPVAIRGYDRQRVDAYVGELRSLLADERHRAKGNAERYAQLQKELSGLKKREPLSFDHLGAEAARVLEQAGNGAKVLMEEARAQCQVLIQDAKAQAAEIGKQATEQANQVQAATRKTIEEATRER